MSNNPRGAVQVTALLQQWSQGNPEAESQLFPVIYDELHRIAVGVFRREGVHHTLQPTAIVHEAYLRLTGQGKIQWRSRKHFFSIAARLMRQVLVDHARQVHRLKRGGGAQRVTLEEAGLVIPGRTTDVLALDTALEQLAAFDQRKAKVVELRFFGGLTAEEVAEQMHLSRATVTREWRCARAWLLAELDSRGADGA